MKKILVTVFICAFLFSPNFLFSQMLEGNWFGIGEVKKLHGANDYLTEFDLTMKGNKVNGRMEYKFRDSTFSTKITGVFNPKLNLLKLDSLTIIFSQTIDTKIAVECPMFGKFTYKVQNGDTLLVGSLYSDEAHKYVSPPIFYSLKKNSELPTPIKPVETLTLPPVEAPKPKDELSEDLFKKREKVMVEEMGVVSPKVKIEFYDNGMIDGDSITIFFNNVLAKTKTMLTHQPITLEVVLDSTLEYNEISMLANNVGLIAPNTASLVVYDGEDSKEFIMASDFNKTATLRLKKKAAPVVKPKYFKRTIP